MQTMPSVVYSNKEAALNRPNYYRAAASSSGWQLNAQFLAYYAIKLLPVIANCFANDLLLSMTASYKYI